MKKDITAVLAFTGGILVLLLCSVFNFSYIFSSRATPQGLLAEGGLSAPGGIFQGIGVTRYIKIAYHPIFIATIGICGILDEGTAPFLRNSKFT